MRTQNQQPKESTKSTKSLFTVLFFTSFRCNVVLSVIFFSIFVIESFSPFGDWVRNNFGEFGSLLGIFLAFYALYIFIRLAVQIIEKSGIEFKED